MPATPLRVPLAWASRYYLPAILADPISAGIGTPRSWVFAAFSTSLLIAAFAGPAVGRIIDRYGGRGVLVLSNFVSELRRRISKCSRLNTSRSNRRKNSWKSRLHWTRPFPLARRSEYQTVCGFEGNQCPTSIARPLIRANLNRSAEMFSCRCRSWLPGNR
jgi:hypothetical protein